MRVTSSFWVAAYVRRCHGEGAFAVVVRRGAEEAGAITVTVDRLDGTSDLYVPAPQSVFDDAQPEDRLFLVGHDPDPFNRWEAAQQIALSMLAILRLEAMVESNARKQIIARWI